MDLWVQASKLWFRFSYEPLIYIPLKYYKVFKAHLLGLD
jgi:hypothetical protein